jgi:hypothetical protein
MKLVDTALDAAPKMLRQRYGVIDCGLMSTVLASGDAAFSAPAPTNKKIDPPRFGDSLGFRLQSETLERSWEAWFFST